MRYWDAPRRFHGKPPRNRDTIISSATHAAAPPTAQADRVAQETERNFSAIPQIPFEPASARRAGNIFQHNHTHVAGYRARKAPSAAHPRIGAHATGMSSSQ